jgi:hypothetical protein
MKRWVFLLRVLFFQPGELAPTLAPSSFSPRFLKGHTKPKNVSFELRDPD